MLWSLGRSVMRNFIFLNSISAGAGLMSLNVMFISFLITRGSVKNQFFLTLLFFSFSHSPLFFLLFLSFLLFFLSLFRGNKTLLFFEPQLQIKTTTLYQATEVWIFFLFFCLFFLLDLVHSFQSYKMLFLI